MAEEEAARHEWTAQEPVSVPALGLVPGQGRVAGQVEAGVRGQELGLEEAAGQEQAGGGEVVVEPGREGKLV